MPTSGIHKNMSLIVTDLSKKYGEKTVLDHLSFRMDKPGVYALLGTNGAGKTTAIRMILGMLSKNSGEVLWNDKPLSTDTCNVGYLAEERGLYPNYSLMDQLIYFAGLRGVSKTEAKKRIKYWAKRLEVEEYLYPDTYIKPGEAVRVQPDKKKGGLFAGGNTRAKKQKPKLADQLSKGNQQKIQLMTALISDPELIILDEPLSGLDPVNAMLLKDVVKEQIAKGKIVLFSSHQMNYVEEFCDSIAVLNAGKVVLSGDLHDIKRNYARDRLVVRTEHPEEIKADFGSWCSEVETGELMIQLTSASDKQEMMKRLVDNYDIDEVKVFEPSLNDIFVEYAGQQA